MTATDELGRCPLCVSQDAVWEARNRANPGLPDGWEVPLERGALFLLECLLAHVGVPTGQPSGNAVEGAVATVQGLWVRTTRGVVALKAHEVGLPPRPPAPGP